eukprot:1161122-Pelagomonas_calceolata.AAC.7
MRRASKARGFDVDGGGSAVATTAAASLVMEMTEAAATAALDTEVEWRSVSMWSTMIQLHCGAAELWLEERGVHTPIKSTNAAPGICCVLACPVACRCAHLNAHALHRAQIRDGSFMFGVLRRLQKLP